MSATTPAILRELADELVTPRLVLRCPRAGDGVVVHEAVRESLADLRAWPASLPWAMAEPSVETSETFCRQAHSDFIRRSSLAYLAFEKNTGQFVISASLHHIDWSVPRFELGYWCRSSRHGQGLAGEAIGALLAYACTGLGARRVECFPDEANVASRALCDKLGLSLEGILRNERIAPDGTLRHTCIYALTR